MSGGVFLVTGGSRGIGAAIAEEAARAGYYVLLSYVSQAEAAHAVVQRIEAAGGRATAVRADTGTEDDIVALFAAADRIGRLAVLVYNGGMTGQPSPLAQAEGGTIRRVLEVNLAGAMIAAREAVRRMSTDAGGQGGAIVFLSSRAALYGSANEHVWYAASKGGTDSLTIGLAREVAGQGIRVNAVSPGPIGTDMLSPEKRAKAPTVSPMRRAGEPGEVAAAVMFLASDAASYVTGANLAVAGGL